MSKKIDAMICPFLATVPITRIRMLPIFKEKEEKLKLG